MEEFKTKINSFFQLGNDLAKYDKVVEDFLKGLEQQSFVSECIVFKTRRQSKKKRNILSTIPDNDNENNNESLAKIMVDELLLPKKSLNPNKTNSGSIIGAHGEHLDKNRDKPDIRIGVGTLKSWERRSIRNGRLCNDKVTVKSIGQVSSLEIVPSADINIELLPDENREKMSQPAQPSNQLSNTFTYNKIILSCAIKQKKLETCTSRQSNSGSARPKSSSSRGKIKQNVIVGNYNTSMNKLEIEKPATNNATYGCVYEDAISDIVIKLEPTNSNERLTKHSEVAVVLQPFDPGQTIKTDKTQNRSIFKQTKVNAKEFQSPAPIRITRMNSRAQVKKENRYANPPLAQIPIHAPNRKILGHVVMPKQNSSSEKPVNVHLKKKCDAMPLKLFVKYNADDIKRTAVEDKKRIHEEKLKHAQEIRDAKERERRTVAERIAREKQGKCKKIVHEREEKGRQECGEKKTLREHKLQTEKQRNLEEIQKNLQITKCIDVKRYEEMHKMKLANMKERDLLDGSSTEPAKKQTQYTFDLLLTDDSSEEEDKLTTKKPPPPTWSLATVRQSVIQEQNYVEWKIIDKLFSIQQMTVDLREIFPNIDSRCLARNSSGIWLTPIRYSVLPEC